MSNKIEYIKFVIVLILIGFLFGFSNRRNEERNLTKIEVKFIDERPPFITINMVNKLLIQNHDSVTSIDKETLVLKEMESRLLKNEMIRDAQVYVTVDGVLGAKIEQREPIGRVLASPDFYLDSDGKRMPLSNVYSSRVPLVSGRSIENFTELTDLLLKIKEDEFMRSLVIGVELKNKGEVKLRLRKHDLIVHFGSPDDIALKFQKFKAFYKKTKEDKKLDDYQKIDLRFGEQVIATKR